MNITDFIQKESGLEFQNEPSNHQYKMFNTGGVELEVGEFLYALVRMIKPKSVLETGTHFGISSTYIALALKHNGNGGKITTIDPIYYQEAQSIHKKLDILDNLNQISIHAENYHTDQKFDLFLSDSEPILRFNEFEKFYNNINDGGIIIIHDLHPHLSFDSYNSDLPNFKHWPYGDFRPTIGKYIKSNQIQTFSFKTPRGITMFQKRYPDMSYWKHIENII